MARKGKEPGKNNGARQRDGQPTISRDEHVIGHTADVVSSLTFTVDPLRRITIEEIDPLSIRRELTHARPGKTDKVITSMPVGNFSPSLGHFGDLQAHYDTLYVIDTNTIPLRRDGFAVSACTVIMVPQLQHLEAGQIRYQPLVSFLILDPSPDQKPEPLGWHLLIRFLLNSGALQGKRVGLIVDSELGDHVQINTRKKPYYADQMLPGNIALIYASADKSDTFANHMIKKCDEIARMLLKRFVAHPQQAIPHERVFVVSGATCIYIDHTGSHARA